MSFINKHCEFCNSVFKADTRELNRGNAKFCSRSCCSKSKIKKLPLLCCHYCNTSFRKKRKIKSKNVFCSKECSINYLNENKKEHIISKEGIDNIIKSNKVKSGSIEYDKNPKKCSVCENPIPFNKRKNKYCNKNCKKHNITNLKTYRTRCKFKFSLNDFPEEFNFSLIKEFGWYSPTNKNNNLNGVSRDHMFSVRNGFELAIEPDIISHPANCRLMLHTENFNKKGRSSISLSELMRKIEKWNKKYKQ